MTYSLDLRERVVYFVQNGGSKADAARIFCINHNTVYAWCRAPSLEPKKHGPRQRKLDKTKLYENVQAHPDALLRERAAYFGVHINAIWVALHILGIYKKNNPIRGKKYYGKGSLPHRT